MRPSTLRLALTLSLLAPASWVNTQDSPQSAARPDNILLIIADDFGREKLALYGLHPEPAPTPVLHALAARGVSFTRFYSQPLCSPTRAAILTGKQAFRTGVGTSVPWEFCETNVSGCFSWDVRHEPSLPRALSATHVPAAIGKWHLGQFAGGHGWTHPRDAGFALFRGMPGNLGTVGSESSVYFSWTKNSATPSGATQIPVNAYATSEQVDDALEFIDSMRDRPWFTWLAFNTTHTPIHIPPASLAPTTAATPATSAAGKHRASVEAMDTEIGRLLDGISPAVLARTWIVFLCDNGPPSVALQAPYPPTGKTKPAPWEGNVNMPLIVVGPGVVAAGRSNDHLVHAVDIFATICELAGVAVPEQAVDSISFFDALVDPLAASRRDVVLTERFVPNGPGPYSVNQFSVTDGRWKWMRLGAPGVGKSGFRFFDLLNDPNEAKNLLLGTLSSPEQTAALTFLMTRRDEILASHGGGL